MILRLADFDLSCIGFCVCCCLGKEWRTLFFFTFWPPLCCSASPYLELTNLLHAQNVPKTKYSRLGYSDWCLHCEPGCRTWFRPVERWLNPNFYSTIVPRSKSFSPVPPKMVLKKWYMFLLVFLVIFSRPFQKLTTCHHIFFAPVHSSKWQQKQRL